MKLYHITKTKNLEKIFTIGLIPGHRKGLTCNQPKWKYVFLTDCIQYIIDTQLGSDEFDKGIYSILEVDCTSLEVETHHQYEYIFKGIIRPHFIKPIKQYENNYNQ